MSETLVPYGHAVPSPADGSAAWIPSPSFAGATRDPENPGINWSRYLSVARRYKWLMIAIVVLSTLAGIAMTRNLVPQYAVSSTVWISSEKLNRGGPIRTGDLVTSNSWPDLVTSYAVLDATVREVPLYLWHSKRDDALFSTFVPSNELMSGQYQLRTDATGQNYTLTDVTTKQVVEKGSIAQGIGHSRGFTWTPADIGANRTVEFTAMPPRQAALSLQQRLKATLPEGGNLMKLELTDSDPKRLAKTMNTLLRVFVATSADLKRRNVADFATTLENQLGYASRDLQEAEDAIKGFGVSTATLPSTGGVIGGAPAGDPLVANYFGQRIERDNLQQDRIALEHLLADVKSGKVDPNALATLTATQASFQTLQPLLIEYAKKDNDLRQAQQVYTDESDKVRDLKLAVERLRTVTIPRAVSGSIEAMKRRETELGTRMASVDGTIKNIPARAVEEMRLRRNVQTREEVFKNLKARYEEAKLAAAGMVPEVSVLDSASVPMFPTGNAAPRILIMAVVGGLALACGLAFLLDKLDPRIRYPEQVTKDLGLGILGAVPSIQASVKPEHAAEQSAQIVESFRSLRLSLTNAHVKPGPLTVTITSPGAGEGKSLVSSNLALSFAEAGYRTLLIDGDIRRGRLHTTFGVDRRPGLLDYLAGDASLGDVVRDSSHQGLTVLPSGTRRHRGPELLVSSGLDELVRELSLNYDAIVIDSPPLGAGTDSFVLGAATENMLMVVRTGTTDRKLAAAKLRLLDLAPVTVLGAVMNDISAAGVYSTYSYIYGYEAEDEVEAAPSEVGALPAPAF